MLVMTLMLAKPTAWRSYGKKQKANKKNWEGITNAQFQI